MMKAFPPDSGRRRNLGEEGDFTFKTRDAAARAERDLVASLTPKEGA